MEVNLRARWWSVEGLLDIHLGLLSVIFLEGVHWLVHLIICGVSCGWSIGAQFGSCIRGCVSKILELIPIGDQRGFHWGPLKTNGGSSEWSLSYHWIFNWIIWARLEVS